MNAALVTTGLVPLTIGSVEQFMFQGFLGRLPWDLTGGTVTLLMTDPSGASYSFPATIQGGAAFYNWLVAGPVGTWVRAWHCIDAAGVVQRTRPIVFSVITSPGTPI